jgi:hypothetical protein
MILYTKVNFKTMFTMDGVDISIIEESIGDNGQMDLDMDRGSFNVLMVRFKKEIGIWGF